MGKKTTSSYKIVWMMEFKQERIPGLETFKGSPPSRLPEIDLINSRNSGEKCEPIVVSHTDKGSHLDPSFIYIMKAQGEHLSGLGRCLEPFPTPLKQFWVWLKSGMPG